MIEARGYAAHHSFSRLKPFSFERRPAGPGEVEIDVLFCGVCHSDIHTAENDWGNAIYPCVPGHEIVGRVRAVAPDVSKWEVGDLVGVGCMIDSCGAREPCRSGDEQYCEGPNGMQQTYNGPMIPAAKAVTGGNMYPDDNTYGGYSDIMVVNEDFLIRIPDGLDPATAAPILCAGITTYAPLRHWGVGSGSRVGVVGLGGLGHMAVKLAVSLGADVTVFTRTPEKQAEAERLGARHVTMEKDAKAQMEKMAGTAGIFDFIISTVPEKHDINPFIVLLKRDCTICVVGAFEPMGGYNNVAMATHRRSVASSIIGGIRQMQEVLDHCAQHGIAPDIEVIPIQQVNEAFRRVKDGDARFRYVIDMASIASEPA